MADVSAAAEPTKAPEVSEQKIQAAAWKALQKAIPLYWMPGLTRICTALDLEHTHRDAAGADIVCGTPGKRPLMKAFNKQALERYKAAPVGVTGWGKTAAGWLAAGDNVGLVPPEGVVVLDCDTLAAVEWVRDALTAGGGAAEHAPVQIRGEDKAHYWLRYDPEVLPLRARRLSFSAEGVGDVELDLRVGGRSQVVVAPSAHVSEVDYEWVEGLGLPEGLEGVPWIPEGLGVALGALLGIDPDAPEPSATSTSNAPGSPGALPGLGATPGASVAGHDRLRAYVNRLCRYSPARGSDAEQKQTLESIRDRAVGLARELYAGEARAGRLRAVLAPDGELDRLIQSGWKRFAGLAPLVEDRTDQGYIDLCCAGMGEVYVWVPERRGWLHWDGACWAPETEEHLGGVIGRLHIDLLDDAAREPDRDRRDRLTAMAKQLRNHAKVASILKRWKTVHPVREHTIDAQPWLVTFPAGLGFPAVTMNLKTDEVYAPRREDWITRVMGAPWVPDGAIDSSEEQRAGALRWSRFLSETLLDSVSEYVQRGIGLSLSGRVTEPLFFFCFGPGGTGKSTLLGAVGAAFGSYAGRTGFKTVTGSGGDGSAHSSDVARLKGLRLVVCSEIPERVRLGARLKDLTGGDRLVARFPYGVEFEFTPSHTLWVAGNTQPSADYLDTGVWRRMRQIPMDVVQSEPDPFLGMELGRLGTRAAIARWAVEGWRAYRDSGSMGSCPEVEAATEAYREESSPISHWWEDQVQTGPGLEIGSGDAYSDYCAYMDAEFGHASRSDVPRASQRTFVQAVKARGVTTKKGTKGKRFLVGMSLRGLPWQKAETLGG